jgi:hypothetical protein
VAENKPTILTPPPPSMNAACLYCGLIIRLDGDYIVLTDSGDWVGHAHSECQKIAETMAVEALSKTAFRLKFLRAPERADWKN